MILPLKACKHDISKTLCVMYVICSTGIAHDPKMYPIDFGSDVMHIDEEAGLKVNFLKCSYLHNHNLDFAIKSYNHKITY